jgi:hypothetical protein
VSACITCLTSMSCRANRRKRKELEHPPIIAGSKYNYFSFLALCPVNFSNL